MKVFIVDEMSRPSFNITEVREMIQDMEQGDEMKIKRVG